MKNVSQFKGSRIYYSTGIISLFLLPVICLLYINKQLELKKQRYIAVNWWDESLGEFWMNEYSFSKFPRRNYTNINISDNKNENTQNLLLAKQEIKRLISTQDTSIGLHFHFDRNATYSSFIKVIEICENEKAKIYVVHDNDVWVFNYKTIIKTEIPYIKPNEKEIPPPILCGTSDHSYPREIVNPYSAEEQARIYREEKYGKLIFAFSYIKKYWVSCLLFIVMTVLSIKRLFNYSTMTVRKGSH
jgi:hypothetical protein